jgi:hypothetical protein
MILDEELDYAVVHKTRENGKVVKVEKELCLACRFDLSK